ncbi:MAG: hypothetical protein ACRDTD_12725, partial [Pseudonocardiaceae bacterium]
RRPDPTPAQHTPPEAPPADRLSHLPSERAECLLLHVSEPLPGKTHDAKAVDELGLTDLLRADNSIGDKGFIGTGPHHPIPQTPRR